MPRIQCGLARQYRAGRHRLGEHMAESLENGTTLNTTQQITKLTRWENRHSRDLHEAWKRQRDNAQGNRNGHRNGRRNKDRQHKGGQDKTKVAKGWRQRRERANIAQAPQPLRNQNRNQNSESGEKRNRRKEERRCWNCNEAGHLAHQCPHPRNNGQGAGQRRRNNSGQGRNSEHATMVMSHETYDIYHMTEIKTDDYREEPIPEPTPLDHGLGGHNGERVGEASHPGPDGALSGIHGYREEYDSDYKAVPMSDSESSDDSYQDRLSWDNFCWAGPVDTQPDFVDFQAARA